MPVASGEKALHVNAKRAISPQHWDVVLPKKEWHQQKTDEVLPSIPEELQAASIPLTPRTRQHAGVPDAPGDWRPQEKEDTLQEKKKIPGRSGNAQGKGSNSVRSEKCQVPWWSNLICLRAHKRNNSTLPNSSPKYLGIFQEAGGPGGVGGFKGQRNLNSYS